MIKINNNSALQDHKKRAWKSRSESSHPIWVPIPSLHNVSSCTLDAPVITLIKRSLYPLVTIASLAGCYFSFGADFNHNFLSLAIVSFLLASHIFGEANLFRQEGQFPFFNALSFILLRWTLLLGCLWAMTLLIDPDIHFPQNPLLVWSVVTPMFLLVGALLVRRLLQNIATKGRRRKAIIIGANRLGNELLATINKDIYLAIDVHGFFDDRRDERMPTEIVNNIIGRMDQILAYIKENQIDLVYVSMPMHSYPRLLSLLQDLRDSTASVYFIPDMYLFDLINIRFDHVGGIPVVSVRDTPFLGLRGLIKRCYDVLFSSLILILISPLLALIAAGIKLSSHGPVLFKQRRYGLDGREIKVYKFRSMTVTEDGAHIKQATKDDQRVTPFGKFLRKTSLDELPQFINVLQGGMSVVGPRPHAVAHNETYRKIIDGYMIRHMVKPGITGWAQVNGLRGETDTLEKMAMRIEFDLEYIRNWSPLLDLWIVLKTIKVLFVSDSNAF